MHKARSYPCICLLFAWLASCEKSSPGSNSASPTASPEISQRKLTGAPNFEAGAAKFEVCGLLKPEEIEAITGSPIEQSNSSGRSSGSLRISQCVYVAKQPSQSVSLVVTQTDPIAPKKRSPKELWRERFARYGEQGEGKREEEEEETKSNAKEEDREGRPPRKIDDLGEEAFWTAGSLYVLQNDVFLRLSVGGSGPEEAKLEQSKRLAAIALKRL